MLLFLVLLVLPFAVAALLLGLSVTVSRSAGGFAAVSGQNSVNDNLGIEAAPITLPAAQPATLTTRTNATSGTLTMTNSNHGIVTGQRLDLYWPGAATPGQTYNVTAGSVSGTTVPITCNTTLAAPSTPTTGTTAGGSLAGTTYYVKVTLVTSVGETVASSEQTQVASANFLLTITSPTAAGAGALTATGYNVYVGNTASGGTGTETKQNTSGPIPIGVTWTEPVTGLVSGGAVPPTTPSGSLSNLPVATSPIVVGIPQQVTFNVTGNNLTALAIGNPQQSYTIFEVGTTDQVAILLATAQGYVWTNADPFANPLAFVVITSVWMSHSFTSSAVTTQQVAALTH